MGGYKRTPIQEMRKSEFKPFETSDYIVEYEDIWDFKMNPSEWAGVLKEYSDSPKEGLQATGLAALRSLVHMVTKPPHIKGRVVMDQFGEFAGQRGLDPRVMKDFSRLMATD